MTEVTVRVYGLLNDLCLPTTSYALTPLNLRTGSGRLGSR
jgi:hypothetical protein